MEEDEMQVEGGPKTTEQMFDSAVMDAPIPGQSFANSPDSPMPFERPPEYTNYEEAQEYLLDSLLAGGEDIIDLVSDGVPVAVLATAACMKGFTQGKWNPDLLLLLLEPAIYIILFICEQAGVEYILDFDEEFEYLPSQARVKAENHMQKIIKDISQDVEGQTDGANISELMPPSLLAKVEESTGAMPQGEM